MGCVGVEVAVCAGQRVGIKARGGSNAAAELRPMLSNLAVSDAGNHSVRNRLVTVEIVKQAVGVITLLEVLH